MLASLAYRYPQDTSDQVRHVTIPAALAARDNGLLRITFTIATPVSPAAIHYADDPRPLGLGLAWFRFVPVNKAGRMR
jgi:hypothetical protein